MTETVEQRAGEQEVDRREPCLCESFARATERAALAAARWLGRDDAQAAEEAAMSGMGRTLDELPIEGRVVIGGGGGGPLAPGRGVGGGGGEGGPGGRP